MKEHTIFAAVFLILAIGFVSFSTTGVTGKAFEEYGQFTGTYDTRYSGPVTTTYSSEVDPVLVGYPSREYSLIKNPSAYDISIDRKILRICLGHLREHNRDVYLEDAEKVLRPIGLANECLPAEQLDINKDGILNAKDDELYGTLLYGHITLSTAGLTAQEFPCTTLDKVQFIPGFGTMICKERPEDASHPFKSSAHTSLIWVPV